jgi:2-oxoisovalerate dehydrogenase E1 component alpha subunit
MNRLESQQATVPATPTDNSVLRVLDREGRANPATDPKLDRGLLLRIYRALVRTRVVDERLTALQRQGRIGFHVGCLGEEASIIGSTAALRDQDWIFSCYREWGAALYRGMALQTYVDNMYGNANDVMHGRQMPDHISARAQRFGSVTAPIGTQISQAVGFAMAARIRKEELVTGTYFGDGATSSNDFHAGMTFAGAFKVPTLFFLRNNGWAISIPTEQQCGADTFADKGRGYGVTAMRCDGNDALAVYACTKRAIAHATSGKGPVLVELLTYRIGPHSTSDDPSVYRPETEVEEERRRDPLLVLRRHLTHLAAWTDQDEETYREEIAVEVRACIKAAERAPKPALSTMFQEVYAAQPEHLREQQAECENGPRHQGQHE